MNLCAVILLNSLALVSVCTSINAGEEEILTNFRNISRAKRGSDVMSLCSNVELKWDSLESKKVPCSVNGNYELHKEIGKGGCGAVYMGFAIIENRDVAIKIADIWSCDTLETEAQVYKDLFFGNVGPKEAASGIIPAREIVGIPQVFWIGKRWLWNKETYNILVMENLGPDLGQLFRQHRKQFSNKTVLMLAEQFLNRIELLHETGYIHRDIKPENFLSGLGESKDTVYLADFGLAQKHDKVYKEEQSFPGTAVYASMNSHLGITQSRRDDMESIGYVLMFFQSGSLPELFIPYDSQDLETIGKMKKRTAVENLCKECHEEFHMYIHYCRGLGFDENPDYEYLRKLFKNLFYRLGHQYDWKFDWTLEALQNTELKERRSSWNTGPFDGSE